MNYPRLQQYATYMHGIRKLYLEFGFLYSLYFFKVSVGKIDRFRPRNLITCDILKQMPQLTALYIVLPREWYFHSPKATLMNFWHPERPCPRIVSRWIYERVAEVLACYEDVCVFPFMDESEEKNFRDLREAARLSWKMNEQELRELYEDEDGGIDLTDCTDYMSDYVADFSTTVRSNLSALSKDMERNSDRTNSGEDAALEMPPCCRCEIACSELFSNINHE